MHPSTRSFKGSRVPVTPNQVSTYDHSGALHPQRKVYSVGALAFNNRTYSNLHDENRPSSRITASPAVPSPLNHQNQGAEQEKVTEKIVFTESPSAPGVPIVYRLPEDKAANPDRLNLDRRRLTVCPILEGEENVRLLNFQHNSITKIQHLSSLRRLIFLDLYDNKIEEIIGINTLSSLRVLMLGKNRITKIENLSNLHKLDVLDLHGNQIRELENLSHLSELRVLNLAGNMLTKACNFLGLASLTELNLRRNKIQYVAELDHLPKLLRLFLSYNDIRSFESIRCLANSPSLQELALDGNPFTAETSYKQIIIDQLVHLRLLDLKKITDDERRMASIVVRKEEEKRRESTKVEVLKERRKLAIQNAEREWKQGNAGATYENGLSYFTEVDGDTLRLYGRGALETLEKNLPNNVSTISQIYFKFIPFDIITPHFPKLRTRFPSLQGLTFSFASINSLKQLNALSSVRRLEFLIISAEGNRVTNLSLWKYYLLYRLSHFSLRKINDVDVGMADVILAEQLFGSVGNTIVTNSDISRILSLLPDVRRKQVLNYCDTIEQKRHGNKQTDDRKKLILSAEQKNRPTGVEPINLASLTYTPSTVRPRSGGNKSLAQDNMLATTQILVEDAVSGAIAKHQKLLSLERIWSIVLKDIIRSALEEYQNLDYVIDNALANLNNPSQPSQ